MVNNCVLGTIFQHSLANMIFLDNDCIWPHSALNLCLSVLWMNYSKYEWFLGSCILERPHFQLFFRLKPSCLGLWWQIKINFSTFPPDKYQGCADLPHVIHKYESLLILKYSKKVGFCLTLQKNNIRWIDLWLVGYFEHTNRVYFWAAVTKNRVANFRNNSHHTQWWLFARNLNALPDHIKRKGCNWFRSQLLERV